MSDDLERALTRQDGETSPTASKLQSGLIVRGRRDAEVLADRAEAEFELESEIKRLSWISVSDDGRSVEAVRQDAESGDAKSQFLIAYRPGKYKVDAPLTWYRKAAEQGYAPAMFSLGTMSEHQKDLVEATKWYRKAAEQGLNEAAFNLGSMYAHGEGVPQDFSESVRWYRKAADGGLADAQYNLALMYNNGDRVPQDYSEAAKWWRRAAEQGHAEACFNLGVLYDMGRGVLKNDTEAAKWYLSAAERSYIHKAALNIGLKYEKGQGVVQDYLEAYKWFHFAVDDADFAGDSDREEKYAAVRDKVSAKLTSEQIVEALRRTEEFSFAHRDVAEGIYDYAEAERLYRKAAEQGNASAQCQLADIYRSSKQYNWFPNVAQDHVEAVKWYRKAAERGDARAQSELGGAYANGRGIAQNYVLAHMYYDLAASNSSSEDRELFAKARDEVAGKITPAQIAEAQRLAREWKPIGGTHE